MFTSLAQRFLALLVAASAVASVGCSKLERYSETNTPKETAGRTGRDKDLTPANLPAGIYPYPQGGALIGQGWDTFNNAGTTGSCVKVDAAKLEQSSFSLEVQQVLSSYSLLRTVQASVSASYKGGGGSVSGSVSKSSSRQIKTDDQNVLFNYESLDGSTFAVAPGAVQDDLVSSEPKLKMLTSAPNVNDRIVRQLLEQPTHFGGSTIQLTPEALDLLDDPLAFRRVCGEGFVAAIHRGVRIQVLLTQSGASTDERNSLSASLSASGYGASGRASYSTSKAEVTSSDKLGYRVFQEGGIPTKPVAITVREKVFDVNSILPTADQLLSNPTAFRVVVVPYANLDRRAAATLSTPLQMMSIGDYYIALNDLNSLVRDMIASAKVNSETGKTEWTGVNASLAEAYGGVAHLEMVGDEILGDLAFLEALMAECYRTRKNCTIKQATSGLSNEIATELNTLKFEAISASDLHAKSLTLAKQVSALNVQVTSEAGGTGNDAARIALQTKLEDLDEVRYGEKLKLYQESIRDGEPSAGFFLRFYWYLTQVPVSTSALNPTLEVPAGTDVEARRIALNAAIVNGVMNSRIAPWKAFFCEELKSEPLCVPDELLRELTKQYVVKVDNGVFKVQPPQAPPKGPSWWVRHRHLKF